MSRRIEFGELEEAVEAARAAGEVLHDAFGGEQEIRYKGEVDLVTDVDERAERVISEMLRGAFPEYGMLAEEGGRTALLEEQFAESAKLEREIRENLGRGS